MLSRNLNIVKRLFVQVKNITELETAAKTHPNHIIQFTATWCGPCKQLSPILYKKEKQNDGKWTVIKVDVDQEGNGEICQKYMLEAIPKLVFVKNGQKVEQTVGGLTSQGLDELIKLIQ